MTTSTTAEQVENLERTVAETGKHIDELIETQRLNMVELRKLQRILAEEERKERLSNSPKARWDRAVKALRKDGVHFRTNMMKCCRGCLTEEDLNLKDAAQPYGYTFGGQDGWIKFNEDGLPYTAAGSNGRRFGYDYESRNITAYINWGNGAGEKIAEAFRAEGFEVVWDGDQYSCVEVKLS